MILASTGIAAKNVDGTAIQSGLSIQVNCKPHACAKLSDTKQCKLRNLLSEVEAIIIDKC